MLQTIHDTSLLASTALADAALEAPAQARAVDWVGMRGIAMPVQVGAADGSTMQVAASVDVAVDLLDPGTRGVHMSRLYLQLQDLAEMRPLTASGLHRLLQLLIDSQRGLSSRARLTLRHPVLLRRPALTSDLAGWKSYPVELHAQLQAGRLRLEAGLSVDYSSTCPASAALSRQANAERFGQHFDGMETVETARAEDFLASSAALAATPHAQRSRADVRLLLRDGIDVPPWVDLIDCIEAALGTPVQTLVKREDEQAFARLNAAHLMFCEDAARRIAAALQDRAELDGYDVRVAHFESLHAHDAVAQVSGGKRDGFAPR